MGLKYFQMSLYIHNNNITTTIRRTITIISITTATTITATTTTMTTTIARAVRKSFSFFKNNLHR